MASLARQRVFRTTLRDRLGTRAWSSTSRHNDRKEHLHMGDKGGKKDKAKSKQQHDVKQKAEVKRNQEKSPRKTS